MITGKNIIGNSLSAKGSKSYKTFNPIKNEENPQEFWEASSEEIDRAVELASSAFEEYRNASGKDKAEFLRAITKEISALGDDLVQMYCMESGLPQGRAEGGTRSNYKSTPGFCGSG